jgi:DNA-binding phage protein
MLIDLWQAALDAETGIAIPTDNRGLLRQHLYRARAEANNPEFERIVMIMPENETELWLVHRDADAQNPDRTIDKGDIEPL